MTGRAASMGRSSASGFTLMEVMVAVAILGTALFILLQAHYGALDLYDTARTEALERNLLRHAMGMAEVDLIAGNAGGSGDFGKRYPDYTFRYEATPVSEEAGMALYDIKVQIDGPNGAREMHLLMYYTGP